MSKLSDNYPVGMSTCDLNGIMGNCGVDCEGFKNGECEHKEDIIKDWVQDIKDKVNTLLGIIT